MKTKLILKGVLLYSTLLLSMLYIAGIDSLMDKGLNIFLFATVIIIGLIFICYETISEEDTDILLLTKYFGEWDENSD